MARIRHAAQHVRARLGSRASPETRSLGRHFAGGGDPLVLTDATGMRFVLYPWELDAVDELLSKAFYRPDFAAIERLLGPGDTAVDVGANVGTHAIRMSRRVGERGRVVAFEPVTETAWLMRENLALNRAANVELFDAAVADAPGTLELSVYDQRYSAWNSRGGATFDGVVPVGTVEVPTVSLDAKLSDLSIERVQFLKIDVEGFEVDVLRGAHSLLSAGAVDCLSFEISEVPLRASGHSAAEVFEFLGELGYGCYRLDERDGSFAGPVTDSSDFYANFYASRRDLGAT